MTPGAHRLHRQPVPIISLDIPDDICQRAQSLGLDVETFLIASLRAVVAKMEETVKEAAASKKPDEKNVGGRPLKRAGRKQVTVQLEPDYLEQVDGLAKSLGITRPDALNLVLEAAISDGIFRKLTKNHA